jgi:hypothetical protein
VSKERSSAILVAKNSAENQQGALALASSIGKNSNKYFYIRANDPWLLL